MAASVLFIALFLGMAGYSSATYCICKDGFSDTVLQKNIDYACGNGADCTAIQTNGICYQPSTVKSHCDYAVNNYYQRKGQAAMSCDFSGTATVSPSLPTTVASGCTYASSTSQVSGSSTTSTTPTTTGTTPTTTGTTPTTTGTTPSTTSSSSSTGYSLGPTGSGIDSTGNYNDASHHGNSLPLAALALVSGLIMVLWG